MKQNISSNETKINNRFNYAFSPHFRLEISNWYLYFWKSQNGPLLSLKVSLLPFPSSLGKRRLWLLRWLSVTETCQLQVDWCENLDLFKSPALQSVESLILLSSSPFFCDESSQLCVLWVLFKFRCWRKAEEQRQLQCRWV